MKRNAIAAFFVLLSCTLPSCHELCANPQGGNVVVGSATIRSTAPNTLAIEQSSDRVIINWQDFSIGANEVTRFVQPSSAAEALNRVVTGNPSLLYGTLQANGRVFLINQNGILVGKGGQIDTAGFTASTLDLSDAAFLVGKSLHFSGNSPASINNLGAITALGGDVFLIAQTVENSGLIRASAGTVGLAAGSDIVLVQRGNERLSVLAGNPNAPSALGVNNVGQIEAASAELKAAGGNIYALAINNGGVVRATGMVHENGHVVLRATGGNIQNSGTLLANNKNGSGGSVLVDGGHDPISSSTVINSGNIEARGQAAGTKGGQVEILGDDVGLFGNARVDVSGAAGGGTALIGGGLHGQDPSVNNAERTYVDQDATIMADARSKGNGGTVVVWADDATAFYGNISARGGARDGNGGFAEVSGENALIYSGFANLQAPEGEMGTLLLDPKFITIQTGGTDKITGNEFFDQNAISSVTFDPARVVTALNGANLSLQANTDINVNNTIDASGTSGAGTLTMQAGRSIFLADNVAIKVNGFFAARINDSDAGRIVGGVVVAPERDSGAATFSMGAGSSIVAPKGIFIGGGTLSADSVGPNSISANTGDMTLTSLSTTPTTAGAGAGNITVGNDAAAGKNITISGPVTSSGTDNGAGAGGNGGSITLNASGNLTVGSATASGGNSSSGAGGSGGIINLSTGGGTLSVLTVGTLISHGGNSTDGAGGKAGNMTLNAAGSLNVGTITSSGGNAGGSTGGTGGNAGNISAIAGATLTMGSVASTGGNGASAAGGNAGNISLAGAAGIAVDGLITTQGGTGSSDGSASAVTLASDGAIAFNNNITAKSVSSHSGDTGSGDTTFGPGVQINADTQAYEAGDGTGTATVDLIGNTPAFRNTAGAAAPTTFTYRQDAAITDANLPALSQFGGTAPTTYTIQSDNGSLTLNAGANVAGSALLLSAVDAITLNASLTLASLVSHSGTAGPGDTTFGAGVQINADSQSYRAGDGTGTATVDLIGNTPAFRNTAGTTAPTTFTYRQDAGIADADIPDASQFGGTVPATYTIQSDKGAVTLDTGAKVGGSTLTLSASGTLTINDALNLASLSASGNPIAFNAGTVTTTGTQTYNNALTLGNDTVLNASTVTFGSTVDGAHGLTVNGNAVVRGAAGNGTALSLIHVTGTTAVNGGTITTAGSQTYDGAVTLGNNATLTSSGGGITFGSTLDGAHQLTLAAGGGTLTLSGTVGGGTPLTLLNIQSAAATLLNADVSASSFSIRSPSAFTGPRVIRADSMNIGAAMTGTGRLTLQPLTDGSSIVLGGSGASGTLGLTTAGLSLITADVLQIGNATAGNITISGPVAPNVPVLSLENTGSVIENSGSGITVPQLAIRTAGPVFLTANGSSGNHIQFLAVQFNGASANQRVLVVNGAGGPNLDATVDGVTGISPASQVRVIVNGFASDTWLEQLAALTDYQIPALTLSTARLTVNPKVDHQLILDLCGPKCIWTPGLSVPWSEEEDGEDGLKSRWIGKVEDQSKWTGVEWPLSGAATSLPAIQ